MPIYDATLGYRVDLLDFNGNFKRSLSEFVSGRIDQNLNRAIVGNCQIVLAILDLTHDYHGEVLPEHLRIDPYNDRVRVYAVLYSPTAGIEEITLGTYHISLPEVLNNVNNKSQYITLNCLDSSIVLEQNYRATSLSLGQGSDILGEVVNLITDSGFSPDRITIESPRRPLVGDDSVGSNSIWISSEYSVREMITQLLQYAGMERLGVTPEGDFIIRDRQDVRYNETPRSIFTWDDYDPADSPNRRRNLTMAPIWEQSSTFFNAVNFISLHGVLPGTEDAINAGVIDEPVRAFHLWWENNDPNDPFSIPSRNRRIAHVETNVEVGSLDALRNVMRARAEHNLVPVQNLTIQHTLFNNRDGLFSVEDILPLAALQDVVEVRGPGWLESKRGVVSGWTLDLANGNPMVDTRVSLDHRWRANWEEVRALTIYGNSLPRTPNFFTIGTSSLDDGDVLDYGY